MASSYEDTHCKRCGKECTAWINGGLCYDCLSEKHLEDIRESIIEGEPDTFSDEYIVCPYCGSAVEGTDAMLDFPELGVDGDHELECEECGKKFRVESLVSVDWETHKMEDE